MKDRKRYIEGKIERYMVRENKKRYIKGKK